MNLHATSIFLQAMSFVQIKLRQTNKSKIYTEVNFIQALQMKTMTLPNPRYLTCTKLLFRRWTENILPQKHTNIKSDDKQASNTK